MVSGSAPHRGPHQLVPPMAAAQAGPRVARQPLDRREQDPDPPARNPHSAPAPSPISKPLRLPSERRRGFPSSSPTYTCLQPSLAGMAIESTMLALGTPSPYFTLPDPATGATVSLDDLAGPALVVTFICNHCPYVKHAAAGLAALGRHLNDQGVAMVAISSNDVVTYPQDGPDQMAVAARAH